MKTVSIFILVSILFLSSCEKNDEGTPRVISILSSSINGMALKDGLENVEVNAEISIVFSSSLDADNLESEVTLSTAAGSHLDPNLTFSNANSKASLSASLDFNTVYTLEITDNPIGKNGEKLEVPYTVSFETMDDEKVHSLAPCTNTGDCLKTKVFTQDNQSANFSYYSNYPIYLENAEWAKLKYAVIVVHGQNRDADNYYSYLTTALENIGKEDSTILLAPWFKESAGSEQQEMVWPSSSGWREGRPSGGDLKISSFAVLDSLIAQLNNKDRFPILEKIIVTGHSSGALFTHLYAGSNFSESRFNTTNFEYIVANSQYFYYTSNERYDEDKDIFFEPSDCTGFNYWPFGYNSVPLYLDGVSMSMFNDQFISRKITYLLGNGDGADPALNTSNCGAVLLGSSRYKRGENMYLYMNEHHADMHAHSRTIVDGVGHNGEAMYKSSEFTSLLDNLLK